jgi:hypothetical protein
MYAAEIAYDTERRESNVYCDKCDHLWLLGV